MVDLGIKPSLARYEFRPEQEFKSEVVAAQDSDESLLAMVQQQADIAGSYLRCGDPRKAITTLRRAHKVVAGHRGFEPEGAPIPPAKRLAFAAIRLQLSVLLSKLGRHEQALGEARAAKHETDEVWRYALGGRAELLEATQDGQLGKVAPSLRKLLTRPPSWLQNVVEASVQARQCIALELEFGLPLSPVEEEAARALAQPSAVDGLEDEDSGGAAGAEAEASTEGIPPAEEARLMHREAVLLAQQLLPDEHPVREGAERAMLQTELRKQEARERVEQASRTLALQGPTAAAAELLLKRGRKPSIYPAALDNSLAHSTAMKLLSALGGEMGQLRPRSPDPNAPITHESLFPPPGDVFSRSRSMRKPAVKFEDKGADASESPNPAAGNRLHRGRSDSLSGTLKAGSGPSPAREREDPFKAWKKDAMDMNKMSMKDLKVRTFEGIRELQAEYKRENNRFKAITLRDTDDDTLYENRTLYTNHGIRASEKAERKFEAWKQKAWKPSPATVQRKAAQRELFGFYGVPVGSSSEPDLKAWGRLLRESHARTPAERERRKSELAERLRREEEERRLKAIEEKQALEKAAGALKGGNKTSES